MTNRWSGSDDVSEIIVAYDKSLRLKKTRVTVVVILFGVLLFGLYFLPELLSDKSSIQYVFDLAERRDLDIKVSATGNLQPMNKVQVSTEISGTIASVHVDFNSVVTRGQILFTLESSSLEAQLLLSKAKLQFEKSKVEQAALMEKKASIDYARLKNMYDLSGGKVPSRSELDTAEIDMDRAMAEKSSAEANLRQAYASLHFDETNLKKTIVRAPIDGVILDRKVEVGQTVASSFEVPELFLIAENLHKLELHVDIDEADVGKIQINQFAEFSVDAFPGVKFQARVRQVRYGFKEVEGVISYETILDVDNDDLSLLPGMTAVADIFVKQRKSALLVPNDALDFDLGSDRGAGRDDHNGLVYVISDFKTKNTLSEPSSSADRTVLVSTGDGVKQILIQVGETDGKLTEVVGGDLTEGAKVVVDVRGNSNGFFN